MGGFDLGSAKAACRAGDRAQFITSQGAVLTGTAATPLSGRGALIVVDDTGNVRAFSKSTPQGRLIRRAVNRRRPLSKPVSASVWQLLFFNHYLDSIKYYLTDEYQTADIDNDQLEEFGATFPALSGFYLDPVGGGSFIAALGYDDSEPIHVFLDGAELETFTAYYPTNEFLEEAFLSYGLPGGEKTLILLPTSACPFQDAGYTTDSSATAGFTGQQVFFGAAPGLGGGTLESSYDTCGVITYGFGTGYYERSFDTTTFAALFGIVTSISPTSYGATQTIVESETDDGRTGTRTTETVLDRVYDYSGSGTFDWVEGRSLALNTFTGSVDLTETLTANYSVAIEGTGTVEIPILELTAAGDYTRTSIAIESTFASLAQKEESSETTFEITYSNPSNVPTQGNVWDGAATIVRTNTASYSAPATSYSVSLGKTSAGDPIAEDFSFAASGATSAVTTLTSSASVNESRAYEPVVPILSDYNLENWIAEYSATGAASLAPVYSGEMAWELKIPYLFFATPETNIPLYLYFERTKSGIFASTITNNDISRVWLSWSHADSCSSFSSNGWIETGTFSRESSVGFLDGWSTDDNKGGYIFPTLRTDSNLAIATIFHLASTADPAALDNEFEIVASTNIDLDQATLKFGETALATPESYFVLNPPQLSQIAIDSESITVDRDNASSEYFGILSYRGYEPRQPADSIDDTATKVAADIDIARTQVYVGGSLNPITSNFLAADWVVVIFADDVYTLYECTLDSFVACETLNDSAPGYYSEYDEDGLHQILTMDQMVFTITASTDLDFFPIMGSYDGAFYQSNDSKTVLIATANMLAYVCALNKHATFLDGTGEQIAVTLGQTAETDRFAALFDFDPDIPSMAFAELAEYQAANAYESDTDFVYQIASQKLPLE
jgi:hypothetical protein